MQFRGMCTEDYRGFLRNVENDLAEFCKKHDLSVKAVGSGKINGNSIVVKFQFTPVVDGQEDSPEKVLYERYGAIYNLPKDAYGKVYTYNGDACVFMGIASISRRMKYRLLFSMLAGKKKGKTLRFPENAFDYMKEM